MRPYEIMVIFDAGAEPPAIQAVVDRLLETIRSNDGVPGQVDRWGRRPFAYEVKHRREGYYVVVELSGEPRTVAEIDRLLSLADEVVRFKVVRLPDKVAAQLASGAGTGPGGHGRPGARGPASRGHGGRGPRTDSGARVADGAHATSGEDEAPARAGREESSSGSAGEGASSEAAEDTTAQAAG
jgi:small subunit ribosomal protein S6